MTTPGHQARPNPAERGGVGGPPGASAGRRLPPGNGLPPDEATAPADGGYGAVYEGSGYEDSGYEGDGYEGDGYDPGQYDHGGYDPGQYDHGGYDRRQYDAPDYDRGDYDGREHDSGEHDSGEYDSGEYDSGEYEPVTGQFPVYGPLDADYTMTLPVIPGRAWPRYKPDDDPYRDRRAPHDPRADYQPPPERRSGRRPPVSEPPGSPFPSYGPRSTRRADDREFDGRQPRHPQDPGYQPPYRQQPGYPGADDRYPGQAPARGYYRDGPAPYPDAGYGPSADTAQPDAETRYPGRPDTRGRHAAEHDGAPPREAFGGPGTTQPEATWAPPARPETGWGRETPRPGAASGPPTQPEATWAPPAPRSARGQPAYPDAPPGRPGQPDGSRASWDRRNYVPPPADRGPRADPGWTDAGSATGTWVLRPPAGAGRAGQPASGAVRDAPAGATGASLLRSSGTMAVGTVASRFTGFVRSAILIYALGTHFLGDAYNISNTLPNVVYQFALGGIFTSVVVPLLVNAAKRYSDRGQAYDQRIFTLGVLALGGVTVLATAMAWPITALYAGGIGNGAAYHLTVILAYFFIPQIFFYGVSSLAGAILNARGSFAAPMWTPVINNLVVIVVGLMFIGTAGLNRTPGDIPGGDVVLLGVGTTLGIVLQTVAMIPSLRRVGFRFQPRYDFRRAEVSEIGRMSGWMFGYVLTTQIAFLVTTLVANHAGSRVSQQAAGAGFAAYSNAYMLFQLPYAIVGISVITAMLPRMSAHAAEQRYRNVAADFSTATRLASVVVVPAALILAVLGGPLAEGVFGYGSTSAASARYLGEIFAVFSLGLLPYMLFQLLLRVFYAMHDSRTPAMIGVVTMTINISANLIALAILPPQHVVAGLGAGFGVANLVGTTIAWRVIGRRIGGLDGYAIRRSLVRMHWAAVPGAIFAIAVAFMVNAIIPGGRFGALLTVALGGSGALLMYVVFAKAAGIGELAALTRTIRARLR